MPKPGLPYYALQTKTPSEKQPSLKDFKEWPKPSSYSLGENYFGNEPKPLWSINMVLKAWSRRNSHAGMQPVWQGTVQMENTWWHDTVPPPSSPGWGADREDYGTFKLLRDSILWIFFSIFYFFSLLKRNPKKLQYQKILRKHYKSCDNLWRKWFLQHLLWRNAL